MLIEAQKNDPRLGRLQHGQALPLLNALKVLQGHWIDQVDLSRDQRRDARAVVGNRHEGHFVDVGFVLPPPSRAANNDGAHTGLALFQNEGPRAVGLERGGVFHTFSAVHRSGGVVGLGPFFVQDQDVGDDIWQDRVGPSCLDLDLEGPCLAHLLDRCQLRTHIRALTPRTVHGENRIVCPKRRTIVKDHALAQVKLPNRG